MSMQVNHIRSLLLTALPLMLCLGLAAFAVWSGIQPTLIPSGAPFNLHPALSNLPNTEGNNHQSTPAETLFSADQKWADPFFRTLHSPVVERIPEAKIDVLQLKEISLSTIALGQQGRYCIVNGEIFHEKEQGDGFTILNILQDRVTFQTDVETFFLVPGQKVAIQSGHLVTIEDKHLKLEEQ